MFKIQERRRRLRINNPASFGILCAILLVVCVGLVYGLAVGVVAPGVQMVKNINATPSPTPTITPIPATPTPFTTMPPIPTPTLEPIVAPGPTATPAPEQGRFYGKTIGIDPARGYESKIKGVSTGVYSNRINYAIATLVKEALEKEGAKVVLSYTDVKSTPTDAARAKALNNAKVDVVLRIDVNFLDNKDTRGAMIWAPEKHEQQSKCEKLAKSMLSAYTKATDLPTRLYNGSGIRYQKDRDIFNETNAPIVTLFIGHISNKAEDQLLNDTAFQQKMTKGILNGFADYWKS